MDRQVIERGERAVRRRLGRTQATLTAGATLVSVTAAVASDRLEPGLARSIAVSLVGAAGLGSLLLLRWLAPVRPNPSSARSMVAATVWLLLVSTAWFLLREHLSPWELTSFVAAATVPNWFVLANGLREARRA